MWDLFESPLCLKSCRSKRTAMIWQRSIACKDLAAELQTVETPWVFGARKSVVLQELNRQAKRQVALTAATGVAVRWGFGMFPDGGVR